MTADILNLAIGLLQGMGASVLFLLAVFIGVCVLFNLPKLRATSRTSLVVKSLDERVGEPIRYLPATTPRGPIDQLGAGTRPRTAS